MISRVVVKPEVLQTGNGKSSALSQHVFKKGQHFIFPPPVCIALLIFITAQRDSVLRTSLSVTQLLPLLYTSGPQPFLSHGPV